MSTYVHAAGMNVDVPIIDGQRIEVVCVVAQHAAPLSRAGLPHPGADARPSIAFTRAQQGKRRETHPELLRSARFAASLLDLPATKTRL